AALRTLTAALEQLMAGWCQLCLPLRASRGWTWASSGAPTPRGRWCPPCWTRRWAFSGRRPTSWWRGSWSRCCSTVPSRRT
ncbi:unnamed protein product, partial [Prorocentrum cordatum]